jgi:integrase
MPAHLRDLTDRARGYVEAASSANTRRAYASTGSIFPPGAGVRICLPCPRIRKSLVCTSQPVRPGQCLERGAKPNSVSTIERRLAAIGWNCTQRGMTLDRKDRAIATVMAGIRNTHATPPRQKEALLPEDLIAMLETLDRGTLRGLRDRAMLLIGFAGGLRRSEITGLDLGRDQTEDGRGWIEILDKGLLITLRGVHSLSQDI